MTYADLQSEVGRRLAEYGGRVYFSDAAIATAINAGYQEMSDASEWDEQYLDIALLNNRPYYDLRNYVPAGLLGIGPAFNEGTNRWLTPTSVAQLDAHDRRWERVTGTPQRVILRGLWWVGYWPRVQSDTGTVKQYYTVLPAPLVLDGDEPGFPAAWHYALVEYALTDLWAQDGETTRALAAWAAYLPQEAAVTAWVDRRSTGARQVGLGDAR